MIRKRSCVVRWELAGKADLAARWLPDKIPTFDASSSDAIKVEAQLIFRRAYYELMQQKGWNTPDIIMENITVSVP